MHDKQKAIDALRRAIEQKPGPNDVLAENAFEARGIVKPQARVNIFTFAAWKALGRSVKKGEKSVHVDTWISKKKTNEDTGEEETTGMRPGKAYLFHVSQTQLDPEWDGEIPTFAEHLL